MNWSKKLFWSGLFLTSVLFLFGCTTQAGQNNTYTLQDVAAHSTVGDCWIALDGNVYNITPMLAALPAGAPNQFANACGSDATATFQNLRSGAQDFNRLRSDFNGARPNLNGASTDFNAVGADMNRTRSDFNGARSPSGGRASGVPSAGGRMGRGFTQYYIGKLY